ncbi:MAG: hypothetical protein IJ506_02400 [Clostridia bacterium]|nr:hypothetical protein [Clostridia bacterium]
MTDKFFDGYFGAASTAMRKTYDRTAARCSETPALGALGTGGNVRIPCFIRKSGKF